MSLRPNIAATRVRRASSCLLLASVATAAGADPADYVFTPYTDTGKLQLAYGLGTEHGRDGSRETQQVLSIGGAPAARWFTSVYAAWASEDGGRFEPDEWSWTNHVQLTQPGTGPVDVGLLCELSRPHDRAEGRLGVTCGPTLQMDTDDLQVNVNPLLSRHIAADEPEKLALGYQWQVRGLVAQGIELGAQGFGSMGPWNHWSPASQQQHLIGPAIFLKTSAFGGATRLDAAWLFGVGDGSPRNTLRLRLEHEF